MLGKRFRIIVVYRCPHLAYNEIRRGIDVSGRQREKNHTQGDEFLHVLLRAS